MTRNMLELANKSADRDIFARQERMDAEPIADFVAVTLAEIVVEDPACVVGAIGFVDESADFVLLARPERPSPAVVSVLLPEVRVEGRNEIIAAPRRSVGKGLRSRKIRQNGVEVDQFSQACMMANTSCGVADRSKREAI